LPPSASRSDVPLYAPVVYVGGVDTWHFKPMVVYYFAVCCLLFVMSS